MSTSVKALSAVPVIVMMWGCSMTFFAIGFLFPEVTIDGHPECGKSSRLCCFQIF